MCFLLEETELHAPSCIYMSRLWSMFCLDEHRMMFSTMNSSNKICTLIGNDIVTQYCYSIAILQVENLANIKSRA